MVSNHKKLLIYTPTSQSGKRRLRIVSEATSRVAERLGFDVEVAETNGVISPYVFYAKGDMEKVPVYCDFGKNWDEERICNSIRSIVYVLSFLPEHDDLQPVRGVRFV